MASTLIETVNINFEDFTESFLTCSTCLCSYDSGEHNPKLLSCSHTVCRSCLERITSLPQSRDTGSFRCPICRETIAIPRGGVPCLPPSFLVNQLIDLMRAQRREVIPRCGVHQAEELLFCETCDLVYCRRCCNDRLHAAADSPSTASSIELLAMDSSCDHTIVPFSIAIKRMSEILLYKANNCLRNLDRAADSVNREIELLDKAVDDVSDQVAKSFQEIAAQLDRHRLGIIEELRGIRENKRRILQDQLAIIRAEKAKVEQECNGLEHRVEVREVTRCIQEINRKLDVSTTLMEPRENAFLRYQFDTGQLTASLQRSLTTLGQVKVSKTFPPLCTLALSSCEPPSVNLSCSCTLLTIDYNGCPRTSGGDPVEAYVLQEPKDTNNSSSSSCCSSKFSTNTMQLRSQAQADIVSTTAAAIRQQHRSTTNMGLLPVSICDNSDGSYRLQFRPAAAGKYLLYVKIFGRLIKNSPLPISVSSHNDPLLQFGKLGADNCLESLCQPVRVLSRPDNGQLVILDTGNNRIKICLNDGTAVHASGDGLAAQSATGLAYAVSTNTLFSLNWRSRTVSQWSLSGQQLSSFTCSRFVEPIDLVIDETPSGGRILVADNSDGGRVLTFDLRTFAFIGVVDLSESTARPPSKSMRLSSSPVPVALGLSSSANNAATTANGKLSGSATKHSCHAITCLALGFGSDLLVGGSFGVHLYSSEGRFIRSIKLYDEQAVIGGHGEKKFTSGVIGGIAVDKEEGYILTTVTSGPRADKAKTTAGQYWSSQAHVTVSSYKTGDFLYVIDSNAAKLKRPSGLCIVSEKLGHVLVADLGNNCVKKYRYK